VTEEVLSDRELPVTKESVTLMWTSNYEYLRSWLRGEKPEREQEERLEIVGASPKVDYTEWIEEYAAGYSRRPWMLYLASGDLQAGWRVADKDERTELEKRIAEQDAKAERVARLAKVREMLPKIEALKADADAAFTNADYELASRRSDELLQALPPESSDEPRVAEIMTRGREVKRVADEILRKRREDAEREAERKRLDAKAEVERLELEAAQKRVAAEAKARRMAEEEARRQKEEEEERRNATKNRLTEEAAKAILDEYLKAWAFGEGSTWTKTKVFNIAAISYQPHSCEVGIAKLEPVLNECKVKVQAQFKTKGGFLKTVPMEFSVRKDKRTGETTISSLSDVD
jgi:hypothetical protein